MGNQCCQCCIQKNDKKQSTEQSEKEIEQQQTIDYRIQKGPTNINVLHKQLYQSTSLLYISSCDEKGNSPQNTLLDKNANLYDLLKKKNKKIGQISEIQNEKIYIFLVLPLYLGEEIQQIQFKNQLKQIIQLIIDRSISEIAIEDVGVKRFGYPRQFVAKYIIENFASQLHRMTNLNKIDFMLIDVKSKTLFELEIQARRQQLITGQSLLKVDQSEDKSLKQPLII